MTMYPCVLKQGGTFLMLPITNFTENNTNTNMIIGFTSNKKAREFIKKVVNQYKQNNDGKLMYTYAKKGPCSKLEIEIPLKRKQQDSAKYELFRNHNEEFFNSLIRHSIHFMTVKDFYIEELNSSSILRIQGIQVEFSSKNVDHLNLYDYNVRVLNDHII